VCEGDSDSDSDSDSEEDEVDTKKRGWRVKTRRERGERKHEKSFARS